jgi:hypothetical protein
VIYVLFRRVRCDENSFIRGHDSAIRSPITHISGSFFCDDIGCLDVVRVPSNCLVGVAGRLQCWPMVAVRAEAQSSLTRKKGTL